ncbi:MAG: DUF4446 family protein [Candidatus Limnocylindrales bacterium]
MPDVLGGAAPLVAAILFALTLVWALLLTRRIRQLSTRLEGLTRGEHGGSLETILEAHLRTVRDVGNDLQAVVKRTAALEVRLPTAIQQVGLVRFNPFDDTGSNQSFALALLDGVGDGVVVSSLHSRQATRLYMKPVVRGAADRAMSDEETEAIKQALAQPRPAAPLRAQTRG